jgi:glycosyltransferase involved in cell wall biosynthesis
MSAAPEATVSPTVTVIIPVHEGVGFLERAVASVLSQDGVELELIVRDDGSRDGSFEAARRAVGSDPRARVDRTAENQGIARTVNAAVRSARGAWVLILHQDCELLDRHALARSIPAGSGAAPSWMVGVPILAVERLSRAERWFWIIRSHLYSTTAGPVRTGRLDLFSENKCDLIRKDAFESLGGFDESIVGGGEDQVLAARARRRGVRAASAPWLRFLISLGPASTVRSNLEKEFRYGLQVKQVLRRVGADYSARSTGTRVDARWLNRVAGIDWILATGALLVVLGVLAGVGMLAPAVLLFAAVPALVRIGIFEVRAIGVREAYRLRGADLAALPFVGLLADLWYIAGLATPFHPASAGPNGPSSSEVNPSPTSRGSP